MGAGVGLAVEVGDGLKVAVEVADGLGVTVAVGGLGVAVRVGALAGKWVEVGKPDLMTLVGMGTIPAGVVRLELLDGV